MPITCVDVTGMVVDVTVMTARGCNVSRCAGVVDQGDPERIEERYAAYRAASDVAQVVASYLRCHPRVEQVAYPGLKDDPSFEVAARTLVGGFGPYVDYRLVGNEDWQRVTCGDEGPRQAVMALEAALSGSVV